MNNTERKLVQLYEDRAAQLSEKLDNDRIYRDLRQAYIYEQKYLYNHNEVLVEKYNKTTNNRLKENWWNFKDESNHLNNIVVAGQSVDNAHDALRLVGDGIFESIGATE